jgi:hypothetical protein
LEPFLVTQDAIPARPNGSINRNPWGIPSLPDRRTAMIDGRQARDAGCRPHDESWTLDRGLSASGRAGWRFGTSRSRGRKVPVNTVGGLGGTLETGRALDYLKAGDDHRKLCILYLGIMDRMGVHLDHFGDAQSRLVGF